MLNVKTGYSFRAAVGDINEVISRLVEIGATYAPISDRASTFGWTKWNKLTKKNGMKPVFGIELAVSKDISAKKPVIDYWNFYAIDDIKFINELLYMASSQFKYEPLLTLEQAINAKGVYKIAGHRSHLEDVPVRSDLFISLSPATSTGYISKGHSLGHRFAATNDNRFCREGDRQLYEVICGRNANVQTYPQWILSEDEWKHSIKGIYSFEALQNVNFIAENCNAKLKQAEMIQPERKKTLCQMCFDGAKKLNIDLNDQTYLARLDRELDLIATKGFEDYFYIVADVMEWSRQKMICGPARGSSGGSLVCYLLKITTIDPIKYGLLFERFIDISRPELPDIDLDFSDQKRDMVFKYMEDKYGLDHVSRLGTVALYRAQSALNETGKILGIPAWETDRISEQIIVRPAGDPRGFRTIEDSACDQSTGKSIFEKYSQLAISMRLEGHPRHYSQHAAGIVITANPVTDYVAVDAKTGATHCDKRDAEDLNLLKIDALGLTQLSVFEDALEMAGKDMNYLETVLLDDPSAFDVFNKGQFSGIFQFNGQALQGICNQIKVENLEDIVSITALARPGPMASGGTQNWIDRKKGKFPVEYPHKSFEPYLKETLGVVTYQEQVMQVCRNIGKMSWEDVTAVRKAMSKSMGREAMSKYEAAFTNGAIESGLSKEKAEEVWGDLCAYGAYGFNRSHAVAYGIVSYWCAYLKSHFPFEFAAATLTHETDPMKQIKMLREMAKEGFDYIPVDKDISTDKWTSGYKDGKRILVGPIQNVKGAGPKFVAQVMSARKRNEPMPARADKLLSNPITAIDSLWPIRDRFNELLPDPSTKNITTKPMDIETVQPNGSDRTVLVFAVIAAMRVKNENDPVNVEKRGYEVTGPKLSLNLKLMDDTDEMFAQVDRFNFNDIGKQIMDRGKSEKAMYAIKGIVPKNFRMIRITNIRFIGFME